MRVVLLAATCFLALSGGAIGQELESVRVKIAEAKIGTVGGLDLFGARTDTTERKLAFLIEVKNITENKIVQFSGWSDTTPILIDNFGNNYTNRIPPPGHRYLGQRSRNAPAIHPGKTVSDVIVFDVPIDNIESVTLTISAREFGRNTITWTLPRNLIAGLPKPPPTPEEIERRAQEFLREQVAEQAARNKAAEEQAARAAAVRKAEDAKRAAEQSRVDAIVGPIAQALKEGTAAWTFGISNFTKRRLSAGNIKPPAVESFKEKSFTILWTDLEQKSGPWGSEASARSAKLPEQSAPMSGVVKADFRIEADGRPAFVRITIGTSPAIAANETPSPANRLFGWHKLLSEKYK